MLSQVMIFFSLDHEPGKTLIVGASYIALECAGIVHQLGYDVSVMYRSILLRGFDPQIADMVGDSLKEEGIKFIGPSVPTSIEKQPDGKLRVMYSVDGGGQDQYQDFDTVLFATGRKADTQKLFSDQVKIESNKDGKIITNLQTEQSSVPNIYAVGDCVAGVPELTPIAIRSGVLLARRLFSNSKILMNYRNCATTVFTPIEYSAIGLTEQAAIDEYGADNIEVYHSFFQPLEQTIPHRLENKCYLKMICLKSENEKVIGFHLFSPHASEVAQGVSVAFTCGATKFDFDNTVGIHPTIAEEMNLLKITKRSGKDPTKTGC